MALASAARGKPRCYFVRLVEVEVAEEVESVGGRGTDRECGMWSEVGPKEFRGVGVVAE